MGPWMKSSSFTRASLSILQPVFSTRFKPGRPAFCSVAAPLPKPQTPLYLLPPAFRATLSDLKQWHVWAASSVGSTFSALGKGPDSVLRRRELRWLVEDAVEQPGLLSSENDDDSDSDMEVTVRADLYEMWEDLGAAAVPVSGGVRALARFGAERGRRGGDGERGFKGGFVGGFGDRLAGDGRVVAVDLSRSAAAVASYNVQRYDLEERISVRVGSWFEPLKDVEGEVSGVVSTE